MRVLAAASAIRAIRGPRAFAAVPSCRGSSAARAVTAEAEGAVAVVTHGHVPRLPAAAEREARVAADHAPGFVDHLHRAAHVVGPIAHGAYLHFGRGALARAAVRAREVEGAG